MKNKVYFIAILYLFLSVSGSLYGVNEKTIRLGGVSGWSAAERRTGISEVNFIRPSPVLVLSSGGGNRSGFSADLSLSFDEGHPSLFRDSTGHYRVTVSPNLDAVDRRYAQSGFGAALFPNVNDSDFGISRSGGSLVVEAQNRGALFSSNNRFGDFTIEFWLNPFILENGEQILLWTSTRNPALGSGSQTITCTSSKNRLQWSFKNFFISPSGTGSIDIDLTGSMPVVPKTWSHHLVRFDSVTGLVEYIVNGKSEAIMYATTTRREGGEVYIPLTGEGGNFVLGRDFSGLMDEFKIHGGYNINPVLNKYPLAGGRIETRPIDLGAGSNGVLKIDASGGRTALPLTAGRQNAGLTSEYRQSGRFLFSDSAEMQFFIRVSDNAFLWNNPWIPVTPGLNISGSACGRYVQIAVDFYPSSGGQSSPYLEELRITYTPDEPPLPPAHLVAVALDGAVQLQWRNSPDQNTTGYLVYYGTSSDDYFGTDAILGSSPVNAGKVNSIVIEGLKTACYIISV